MIDVGHLAACVEKLYRNTGRAKEYSEADLAFARSLSWDKLMPQWLQLISSTAGAALSLDESVPRGSGDAPARAQDLAS